MKTTIEIPDDLMRRAKMRAAERNQKLKDTFAQLLEAGFASSIDSPAPNPVPRPVRLKRRRPLTIEDIEQAIGAGRA